MRIAPHSRLVMVGDSVTDCERARPVGEGLFAAVGKSYVMMVDGLLNVAYPAHQVRVSNLGSNGNNVRDLLGRWQTDVIDLKPDWVSIMIGINDVWRQFDLPRQSEIHVGLSEYEDGLNTLAARTRPLVKGLVMMTPFYIESLRQDAMRQRMDEYGAAVKRVAAQHGALLVDTQAAFDRLLQHTHSAAIAWDRVHPNHLGHLALARAFLDAVGYEWKGG